MIETLIQPVTVDEARAIIYGQLQRVGVRTGNWKPGAVTRTIVAVVAVIVAAFSEAIADLARMYSYGTARGEWLRYKASGDGVAYARATAAAGPVRLTNNAGGVFSVAAGDLVVSNPTTGVVYRNTEAFALGALGTVDVNVLATTAGANTTSAAGTITELVSVLEGVTVTNQSDLVGTDDEEDELLRVRARQAPGLLSSAGPADAYSYAVKTLLRSDGTAIGVTRSRTITASGGGAIVVVAATATGAVSPADIAHLQDRLIRDVLTIGPTLTVESAISETINVSFSAYTRDPSLDVATARIDATNALRGYLVSSPIGGYRVAGGVGTISRSALSGIIQAAIPGCFRVDISLPTADVELAYNEVAVLGTVTGTISTERQL